MLLSSLLGARNSTRRVVSVVVIGMVPFIATGFFYHDVIRQTITGIVTFSVLLVILPILLKKGSKNEPIATKLDRDEASPARKPIDNRSQEK
jgi:undecaprenyl pyrophosphate phosphatase UppP